MKINPFKVSLMATAIGLASGSAIAADMRIDGFASVYYGQALEKDELGEAGNYQGYTDKADFQQDSVYGIQFRGDLGNGLSATGQVVGRGSTNFDAQISWAYLTYQFNDDLAVKAGRQRIPYFLYSDFLDVGYAYTWISPPAATYYLAGFDNIDGLNFEYTKYFGDWASRVNFVLGASDLELESTNGAGVTPVTTEDFWNITWNLNYDWFTFQINYSSNSTTINRLDELAEGIQSFVPLTEDQYNALTIDGDPSSYSGIGISGDWGTWLASAEYTLSGIEDSPISEERKAWYVMGGYRWDKLTFALTYSEFDAPNNPDSLSVLDPLMAGIEPFINASPDIAQLYNGINEAYYLGEKTEVYNLTIRYDFHPSAAFKFDYTESDRELYKYGETQNLKPSIVRMGVDLVF